MGNKIAYLIIILNLVLSNSNQALAISKPKPSDKRSFYSLTLRKYNHDELINGELTFKLNNDRFTIAKNQLINQNDNLLYSKKIRESLIDQLKSIKLDTLQNYYFNRCVLATSGTEFFISISKDTIKKDIYLHHYYNQQIEQLISNLNKLIPDKYKIKYMSPDTKQDCDK